MPSAAPQAHFLRRVARARGLAELWLTPEAVRQLQSYPFPLNLRELEGLLERATAQVGPECTSLLPFFQSAWKP